MRRSCLLGLTLFLLLGLLAACGEAPDKENPACRRPRPASPAGWRRWRGAASGGQPGGGGGKVMSMRSPWASAPWPTRTRTKAPSVRGPDSGGVWRHCGGDLPRPAGEVTGILVEASGFDDLCALYLQVLEDLWATDPALNGGVAQLGLDLSQTRLSPAEQGAVGVALSWQRDCPVLTGTWEALADQGYIDRERVEWDDGLFLSLAEENPSGALTFTAQKWRSGTGAYWFTHCTARQNPSGHWDGYTVGGEAIS